MSYSVYKAMSNDVVVYYGQTGRDVEERYTEHRRQAQRLQAFQCKELIMAIASRRNELSFDLVEGNLTKLEASRLERFLIKENNPLGNETMRKK